MTRVHACVTVKDPEQKEEAVKRFKMMLVLTAAGALAFAVLSVGAGSTPRLACTINGTPGNDEIHGTGGNDVICGRGGSDDLYGGYGNDVIYGGDGADNLYGQHGDDQLYGNNGGDFFQDGPGADRSYGGEGMDYSWGGGGNDRMYGGPDADLSLLDFNGRDYINGGNGNDHCLATWDSSPGDTIYGGLGRDLWYADNGDTVKTAEVKVICFAE